MARTISVQILADSRQLERAFKNAGLAGSKFGRTMRGVGKVAGAGFAGGLLAAGYALKRGFGELSEAQSIAAQTRAVLKSTGGVAGVSAKQVDKLSASLARMSGVDDEAIAAGQNMLLTFTNIRNGVRKSDKVFDKATATILDMSVALGRDIPDVAIMVGKALNDLEVNQKGTITGWSALRRVGVNVSADMMKMAASFIRAGKPMEAQKLLLRELNTEFGGSAKEYGKTIQGTLGRLNQAFDEITASFASGFLPMLQKVAKALTSKLADPAFMARVREFGNLVATKLYNGFKLVGNWFAAHWPQIQEGFRTAGRLALKTDEAVRAIAGGFKFLMKAGYPIFKIFTTQFKFLLAMASGFVTALSKIPGIGGKFKGAADAINKAREGVRAAESQYQQAVWGQARRGQAKGAGAVREAPGALRPRALGGPVMPGVSYRVGERGPEVFTPGIAGSVTNGGSGVTINGNILLPGVTNAQQFLRELQRMSNSGAGPRSGRYGGQILGIA